MRIGLYDDSAGEPGDLILDSGDVTTVEDADTTYSCDVSATYGDPYFIVTNCDTNYVTGRTNNGSGGYGRYKNFTYGALPDPAGTGYSTYTANAWIMSAYGYPLPSIVSVGTGGEITVGETGAAISGLNLLDSAGQPAIELCNNADYASATVKVTQSNVSCTDTTGTFDVVQGGLTADTTVYAFVTTGLGQRNTTGVAVTLNGSGSGTDTTPDPILQTQSIENVSTGIDTVSTPDPVAQIQTIENISTGISAASTPDPVSQTQSIENVSTGIDTVSILESIQQTQTVLEVDTGIATASTPDPISQTQSVENVLSAIDTASTPGPISQTQTVSAVDTGIATASTPDAIQQTQTVSAVETAAESDTASTPGPISQTQTVSAVDTGIATASIPDSISQIQSIQDVGSLNGSISTPDPISCSQSIGDVQTVYTSVSIPNAIECIQYIFDVPTESSDIKRGVLVVHTVRDSIVKILGDSSAGNFNVIGYKEISIDESELTVPLVTVQIDRSDFDNGSSGILGPYKNDAKCIITIIGSAASDIDLSVIEDPSATVEQKQVAIAAMKSAEENAQKLIEYAIHDIFNIINGVDNFDLGQDDGIIKSRSLSGFKVNDKMVSGELVTVFAEMYLDFTVNEDVTGVTPVQADSNFATGSVLVYNDESVGTPQSMDLDIVDGD